jgi:hypothetical protein
MDDLFFLFRAIDVAYLVLVQWLRLRNRGALDDIDVMDYLVHVLKLLLIKLVGSRIDAIVPKVELINGRTSYLSPLHGGLHRVMHVLFIPRDLLRVKLYAYLLGVCENLRSWIATASHLVDLLVKICVLMDWMHVLVRQLGGWLWLFLRTSLS